MYKYKMQPIMWWSTLQESLFGLLTHTVTQTDTLKTVPVILMIRCAVGLYVGLGLATQSNSRQPNLALVVTGSC